MENKVIALCGNPNVGKSTVFNSLTGLNQHTGNWPGKTVSSATGYFDTERYHYTLVDLPGTYSLFSHSPEEEIARDFICFKKPDACIVVCDATCLERNLNLVLQTLEITKNVIVCVNLMDEAKRKHIDIDFKKLSLLLGVPVVGTTARKKKSLTKLTEKLDALMSDANHQTPYRPQYALDIEESLLKTEKEIAPLCEGKINPRWLSLRLFDLDNSFKDSLNNFLGFDILEENNIKSVVEEERTRLKLRGYYQRRLKDTIATNLIENAEKIAKDVLRTDVKTKNYDRLFDRILTGKLTGFPIMLLLFGLIFWITIVGANYPSSWLSSAFSTLEGYIFSGLSAIGIPLKVNEAISYGVFRVVSWVVSVMLPPMAIFFPLFTLLEDVGYLPRIAYNLDKPFKKCSACGKQALTMCMGFGCNAVGVVGARIIDSPRERLLAILTNNFVPCNGRFPAIITLISIFFVAEGMKTSSFLSAGVLTLVILLGILMTFFVSFVLSKTLLKGIPSSFTLELPPYRPPQVLKVLVRSVFDRTLFVLGRAVTVAAPAGLIIWVLANFKIYDITLLKYISDFLDPFGKLLGMDGVIIMAFILGFPANEIVLPLAVMAYAANSSVTELGTLNEIRQVLIANGWTFKTALCTILFSLMHWPCSTTMLTIKKETNSLKWTLISFLLPTAIGIIICFLTATILKLI